MDTSTQQKTKEALLEYVLTLDDERMVAETATEQFVCATEGFFCGIRIALGVWNVVFVVPLFSGVAFQYDRPWVPVQSIEQMRTRIES